MATLSMYGFNGYGVLTPTSYKKPKGVLTPKVTLYVVTSPSHVDIKIEIYEVFSYEDDDRDYVDD